ncbi:MAG TPA: dihydrodipicolinate synthase family protein [Planctomycetota bacterium]|nr:dihydrodipicolinate synthase family protein [Planctomycetota bacterium]
MKPKPIAGLIAAAHTPFDEQGELRLEIIDLLAARFARSGVRGVFVCGTTGEFFSLDVEERLQVAERWAECTVSGAAGERLALVVHIGGVQLREAVRLARHAKEIGADAIASIGPGLPRPASPAELARYLAEISAACDLPLFLYHIPALTGVTFTVDAFLSCVGERVPTLRGVKFSALDLVDFGLSVEREQGRYTMLFGVDEALLSALVLGAHGAVGTTYGILPSLGQGLVDSFRRGDLERARELEALSERAARIFERHGGHAAMKAIVRFSGIDCGPMRAPGRTVEGAELRALIAELDAAGLLDLVLRD